MNTYVPEMMTAVTIFGRAQEGDFSFQSCQIWRLSERAHSPSLPFQRVRSSVSGWCAMSWQSTQKWSTEKHGLCFAETSDTSPPLSRMRALYATNPMTTSKARCTPWSTTIPILFWWITQHQKSQMEPLSYASPWKSIFQSSVLGMVVSRLSIGVWTWVIPVWQRYLWPYQRQVQFSNWRTFKKLTHLFRRNWQHWDPGALLTGEWGTRRTRGKKPFAALEK